MATASPIKTPKAVVPFVKVQPVEDVLSAEACAKLETREQASCKAVRLRLGPGSCGRQMPRHQGWSHEAALMRAKTGAPRCNLRFMSRYPPKWPWKSASIRLRTMLQT